jgi:hypothetical protein
MFLGTGRPPDSQREIVPWQTPIASAAWAWVFHKSFRRLVNCFDVNMGLLLLIPSWQILTQSPPNEDKFA